MTGTRNLAQAFCDRALPPAGPVPEWVHLIPEGHIVGRDGREFELKDPGALVLAFQGNGADLLVDFEHQNDRPEARLKGPVPAAGWIKELKAAAGGLWGRVEWTATAREMIGRKEYRYLSPSFLFHPKTGEILRLKGAGLVHNPNFALTALAREADTMPATDTPPKAKAPKLLAADAPRVLAGILELLGLPGDSDEAAILERIDALVQGTTPATARQAAPDPRAFVPASAVQEMVKERRTERLALAAEQAKSKVNDALRQGYITPALKGWALALCEADPASFDAFLATSGPVFAYLFKETHTAGAPLARHAPMADSHAAAAICSQLGLKPDALNSTSP